MTTDDANTGGDATADTNTGDQGGDTAADATTSLISDGDASQQNDGAGGDTAAATKESADGDKSQQKDGESDGKNQDDQSSETPTEYEAFALPEGFELDAEADTQFKGLLSEMEKDTGQPVSQENAQKFVDMGANLVQQGVELAMQRAADYHSEQTNKNIEAFKTDPDIGGTEEAQQATLATAKRVATAIGGDNLMKALDETGAGNRVEVIRLFHTLKDIVGEDGKLIIANQGGGTTNLAQRLYPNQT